ncbi:MAG: SCO family protein [Burkholderiaceae bacterium]
MALGSACIGGFALQGCSPAGPKFTSTDITGSTIGKSLHLTDHNGQTRTLADFTGKTVVVFFGYTQCPDVCPTSMSTMADVKRLLGADGDRLQVVFITLDPERDTTALLKSYMQSFDASFLALRPTETELKGVVTDFKIYFKQVPGNTPSTYTVDHSAGKFVYDAQGRIRLFSAYGTAPAVIAADIKTLMGERSS